MSTQALLDLPIRDGTVERISSLPPPLRETSGADKMPLGQWTAAPWQIRTGRRSLMAKQRHKPHEHQYGHIIFP